MSLEMDIPKVLGRIEKLTEKAQFILDNQVLKDSNYYAPQEEGTLISSGVLISGGGMVTWSTPYTKKQYYLFPNKNKKRNPNARTKWFEAAKAAKRQEWLKISQAVF